MVDLFHKRGRQAWAGAPAERVEDEKSLRTGATIRHSPDFVHEGLHVLPADGIAASGKIIRRVFFTVLKELRVIKGAVSSSADFICSKKPISQWKNIKNRLL